MKNFQPRFIRAGLLAAAMISSLPLHADGPLQVSWNQVCRVAERRELLVTTVNDGKIEGTCVSINVDEIAVMTKDHKVVKIARQTLSKLELQRKKGHQLRALGNGMHEGLRMGFGALFSPWAPAGIVAVPGTLVWGAIAAPFCLVGDLAAKVKGTQEIKPI
jgi:hypothetical protein